MDIYIVFFCEDLLLEAYIECCMERNNLLNTYLRIKFKMQQPLVLMHSILTVETVSRPTCITLKYIYTASIVSDIARIHQKHCTLTNILRLLPGSFAMFFI